MKKLRIVIVDDDQDFAESMMDIFELKGHYCKFFLNGEEAVNKILEQDCDVVFMDVKLPGKNGVECFLDIRKIKPHIKVIMMTGFSMEETLNQAVQNGAWEILRKPLDIDNVIQMINKIHPMRIMVADDDRDFVNNLEEILENAGYEVLKADNGQEVIERIQEEDIDILILDLRMPVLNGLETFFALQQKGVSIPTFIVTAFAKEESHNLDILKPHCTDRILAKPFDPECLIECIHGVTGR